VGVGDDAKAVLCLRDLSKRAPNPEQIVAEFIALTTGRAIHREAITLGTDGRLEGSMTVTDWWQLWGKSALPSNHRAIKKMGLATFEYKTIPWTRAIPHS